MTITVISLAGTNLDLDTVEYNVAIQHGRSDVTSSPQASNCQIVIRGPVGVTADITDTLEIFAYGAHRFTGEISDISITHLSSEPPVALTTIIAMGRLSRIGSIEVGVDGYPQQTVRQRVEEILDETGEDYANGADPDVVMHSISGSDIQPTDALSALASLAEQTGATYYDDPIGRIVFESYGARGLTTLGSIWANQPNAWTFYNVPWSSFVEESFTWVMPSEGVVFTPTWSRTRQTIVNDVTVLAHNDTHEAQLEDSASIATYGRRSYRLQTDIKNESDCITRAGNIITAQANPLWSLGQISIFVHQLGATDRTYALELVSGKSVSVIDLPQPAPLGQFTGIVEGWSETYSNNQHILTLSISDPRYSFQTITWSEVDPVLEWGDIDPALKWYEIITGENLAA